MKPEILLVLEVLALLTGAWLLWLLYHYAWHVEPLAGLAFNSIPYWSRW